MPDYLQPAFYEYPVALDS